MVAGSGLPGLSADFIVAPVGGGDSLIGGVYSAASVELEVAELLICRPHLEISHSSLGGQTNCVRIEFAPCAGWDHFVEYRDQVAQGPWRVLPGPPHNGGIVMDTNTVRQRFYRVRRSSS